MGEVTRGYSANIETDGRTVVHFLISPFGFAFSSPYAQPCLDIVVETTRMAKTVSRLKLPTVHLRSVHRSQLSCLIEKNHQACDRLAADHFREQRFRHFAFCGYPGVSFSDQRCASFTERVGVHGHAVLNCFTMLTSRTISSVRTLGRSPGALDRDSAPITSPDGLSSQAVQHRLPAR